MTDDNATDPLGNIPRYVLFRGKRARVIGYEDGMFLILDSRDMRWKLRRDKITFLKEKKK